jgi:putative endonuclease
MAAHNELGKKGESLAASWLRIHGYELLFQNWRHAHFELDLIARKEQILHFIEVKSRTSQKFGYPEESVSEKKMQNLLDAAEEFLYQYPQWKHIQFDILSIYLDKEGKADYYFIEDVYL